MKRGHNCGAFYVRKLYVLFNKVFSRNSPRTINWAIAFITWSGSALFHACDNLINHALRLIRVAGIKSSKLLKAINLVG